MARLRGVFNNENLAAGINLGSLKTPMSAQAMEVYRITTKRGDIQHDRWRDVQIPLAKYTLAQKEMTVLSMNLLGRRGVAFATQNGRTEAAFLHPRSSRLVPNFRRIMLF